MPRLGTGLGTGAVSGDERHADGVALLLAGSDMPMTVSPGATNAR